MRYIWFENALGIFALLSILLFLFWVSGVNLSGLPTVGLILWFGYAAITKQLK
jgi:hypothetical protein